ncbi:MAG: hypothetical protein IJ262_05715 [Clostridia bacterium]|nr:hypothetical protein [Clostridia bacterium]
MNNFNQIDNIQIIDPLKLRKKKYFVSLVNEGINSGLISENDSENIQSSVVFLFHKICSEISEKGHSSISSEKAEELLSFVDYNVSLALRSFQTPEEAVKQLLEKPLKNLFEMGLDLSASMLVKARARWTMLLKNVFSTDNEYYNTTIIKTVKEYFFFAKDKYCLAKNFFFEYPVFVEDRELQGVELVLDYLEKLYCENRFCLAFLPEKVSKMLSALDVDEENKNNEMLFNIFEFVFSNAIGCLVLRKNPFDLEISVAERAVLENGFKNKSEDEIRNLLLSASKAFSENLEIDEKTGEYLEKSAVLLASKIHKSKSFTNVFLCAES